MITISYFSFSVAPIDHVFGTLGIVGATSTQRYSEMSKLKEEIEGPGSYTFFAPSNEAWNLLDRVIISILIFKEMFNPKKFIDE